jgi:hypothetical protein
MLINGGIPISSGSSRCGSQPLSFIRRQGCSKAALSSRELKKIAAAAEKKSQEIEIGLSCTVDVLVVILQHLRAHASTRVDSCRRERTFAQVMIGVYFLFCLSVLAGLKLSRSCHSHTLLQSSMAATAARRSTADAWRAEAGLHELQLAVLQAL